MGVNRLQVTGTGGCKSLQVTGTGWCKSSAGNWYSGGVGYTVQGSRPPVAAPQQSQIPGLGDRNDDAGTTDARRLVRDTDSAYVRLAKQGGQRNLLSMEPDPPRDNSDAARHAATQQQKPDWYYDDDDAGCYDSATRDAESQLPTGHVAGPYVGGSSAL